jgi:hypothetical protein
MKMDKPIVSERFDLNDIRKIRDYNSACHANMTQAEIIEDTRKEASGLLESLIRRNTRKTITILSNGQKTVYEPTRACVMAEETAFAKE